MPRRAKTPMLPTEQQGPPRPVPPPPLVLPPLVLPPLVLREPGESPAQRRPQPTTQAT
jgi:hypothetical protein